METTCQTTDLILTNELLLKDIYSSLAAAINCSDHSQYIGLYLSVCPIIFNNFFILNMLSRLFSNSFIKFSKFICCMCSLSIFFDYSWYFYFATKISCSILLYFSALNFNSLGWYTSFEIVYKFSISIFFCFLNIFAFFSFYYLQATISLKIYFFLSSYYFFIKINSFEFLNNLELIILLKISYSYSEKIFS